ncbi:MAG: LysR family transcriptional regulator [Candidatus Sericytochromatia bacterium]
MLSRLNLSITPAYSPRLKTNWIRYFLVCCRLGHIAEAASDLGISTQALNRNLNALEHTLQRKLFQRNRGGLILTSSGQRFEAEAQLLLDEIEALSSLFQRSEQQPVSLRLGWSRGWEHEVLSEVLSQTLASLPFVFPRISHYPSQQQLEAAVLKQELDFGLACRQPQLAELASIQCPFIPYAIVSAPQPRRHWSQFRYSVLVDPETGCDEPAGWNESSYPRSRMLETDSLNACLEICRQGLAASCLPLDLVEPWLQSRELAIVAELPEPLYLTPVMFWAGELPELGQVVLRALQKEVA